MTGTRAPLRNSSGECTAEVLRREEEGGPAWGRLEVAYRAYEFGVTVAALQYGGGVAVVGIASGPDQGDGEEQERIGARLVDLVAALLGQSLAGAAPPAVPPETHRQAMSLQIKAFIREHLADPELTPSRIATAHHISRSYLHRLFQHEGSTVAAHIRHLRLEAARRDLADPDQRGTPIHVIGARWGFPRAADFTRAFRTAYHVPPSAHRHRALRAPARN